ncbi:MAG: exopolysaccharide biosynthesis protein [Chlamydiae bacterium]|nr:exopolysaccharide biosynthesis protein [Chlamydiota bacterium]
MKKKSQYRNLEDTFALLGAKPQKGPLTIERVLKILSGKGRYLLVFLLSIPFCFPIEMPWLSIPIGAFIAFMGLRMSFGKQVWLPESILTRKISVKSMKGFSKGGVWVIQKMKYFLHPRLDVLCHSTLTHYVNGCLITLLGVALALPYSAPLVGLTAAWSLLLLSLGLLEDDGVVVIIGYVSAVLTFVFYLFT